ncbi:hypothetical protein CPLU01_07690 [Colletotrichum plurivorum]|uniref:Uncharacterized protein n=1 Tax=Colletotrichum plurivorum TaxID=2175906 RepID=A0A8H6KDZ9_9PEZI|nr:hypothetical protein CPLU01_07690 [Colletotrichum plurivorum]
MNPKLVLWAFLIGRPLNDRQIAASQSFWSRLQRWGWLHPLASLGRDTEDTEDGGRYGDVLHFAAQSIFSCRRAATERKPPWWIPGFQQLASQVVAPRASPVSSQGEAEWKWEMQGGGFSAPPHAHSTVRWLVAASLAAALGAGSEHGGRHGKLSGLACLLLHEERKTHPGTNNTSTDGLHSGTSTEMALSCLVPRLRLPRFHGTRGGETLAGTEAEGKLRGKAQKRTDASLLLLFWGPFGFHDQQLDQGRATPTACCPYPHPPVMGDGMTTAVPEGWNGSCRRVGPPGRPPWRGGLGAVTLPSGTLISGLHETAQQPPPFAVHRVHRQHGGGGGGGGNLQRRLAPPKRASKLPTTLAVVRRPLAAAAGFSRN